MIRKLAKTTVITVASVALLVACNGPAFAPTPEACDGIDAAIGGCDSDRPQFAGTTCAELGAELGRELDRRIVAIIEGPAVVDERTQASRATAVVNLATSLLNRHIREPGGVDECSSADLFAAAEPEFSEDLRAQAGAFIFDGVVASYDEWVEELMRFLRVVDG